MARTKVLDIHSLPKQTRNTEKVLECVKRCVQVGAPHLVIYAMHSNAIFFWGYEYVLYAICLADPTGGSHKYVNISDPTTAAAITENNENISIKIKIKINRAKKKIEWNTTKFEIIHHRTLSIFISHCCCRCSCFGADWGLSNRLSRHCHLPCHCQPVFVSVYRFEFSLPCAVCCVLYGLPRCAAATHEPTKTEQTQFCCMTMTLLKVPVPQQPPQATNNKGTAAQLHCCCCCCCCHIAHDSGSSCRTIKIARVSVSQLKSANQPASSSFIWAM